MTKFFYSNTAKVIAVLLLITSIVLGALSFSSGIIHYQNETPDVYSFESDFSQSWYLSYLLNEPENLIFKAHRSVYHKYNVYGIQEDQSVAEIEQKIENLPNTIQEAFDHFNLTDKVNYYVEWNNHFTLTNCDAEKPEDLMQDEYYSYVRRDTEGNVTRHSSLNTINSSYLLEDLAGYDAKTTMTICCSIKEDAIKELREIWLRQESIVKNCFVQTLACIIFALAILIHLLVVCGTDKNGEHRNVWIDDIWTEVHLIAILGLAAGGIGICFFILDSSLSGHFPLDLAYLSIGAAVALASFVVITSLLSIVRSLKTKKLAERTIILRALKWFFQFLLKIVKRIGKATEAFWATIYKMLSKKTSVILITMLFVYTALIGLFGIGTPSSPIWLILGIVLFLFACFTLSYWIKDLEEIKKGVVEVRNGNVTYQIPEVKCKDMKELAKNVNEIATGLDETVVAKVKAERMKSELITNVSHDLKTPITSIITYTELLSKVEDLPEEAKDYASVIAKKSDRLKTLTQDLFDISKVQSGNEEVFWEKLDVALLINQAIGEQDSEIQNSGLMFCVNTPKELYISADGRKMSRVVGNLIGNILKYSMKNTRVFINASEKDEWIEIEFKNISGYPLDFDPQEITQRFVRGDESRTEEGNGLGLAIVKSYTEICNGSFEIITDGDLFKAILNFPKYC